MSLLGHSCFSNVVVEYYSGPVGSDSVLDRALGHAGFEDMSSGSRTQVKRKKVK